MKIVALPGSLRRASYNRALLAAASSAAPDGMDIAVHALNDIPLYDADVEERGMPASVIALREAIADADGLLIATPEYNQSVPGVLKNAVDWVSRPPRPHPFDGKPTAVLGATPGRLGTRSAQYHLRQSLAGLNALVMAQPMLMLSGVHELFDEGLRLTDAKTEERLVRFLTAFGQWIGRLAK